MPAIITEKFDSRSRTESETPTVELLYSIQGTDDDSEVSSLVASTAPSVYAGRRLDGFSFRPLGGGVWEAVAFYSEFQSDSQFSFETGGGNQQISNSLATIASYAAPGETAPNFFNAIGVNDDRVAGTDITVPIYNFAETHYLNAALITSAYRLALFALTGRVNAAVFKGFAAGEVLFLGASGSKRGFDDWEISYRFAASPNVGGLSVGSISGISKEGWQYLWIRFADDEDSVAHTLIKKPIAAYVEQVYQYGDFSLLGIGV